MNIREYSEQAITTLLGEHDMTDMDATLVSQVFGLVGESGEVAEKFKKLIRDNSGQITEVDKKEIIKALKEETAEIGKNRIEIKMMAVERAAESPWPPGEDPRTASTLC